MLDGNDDKKKTPKPVTDYLPPVVAKPAQANWDDDDVKRILDAMQEGTFDQESSGNYQVTPNKRTGATGGFQVMPGNIGPWTEKYVGRRMSREEFERDNKAQDAVFRGEMGSYVREALKRSKGNTREAVRRAAAAWYGGLDDMDNFAANFGGKGNEPTFNKYTESVANKARGAMVNSYMSSSAIAEGEKAANDSKALSNVAAYLPPVESDKTPDVPAGLPTGSGLTGPYNPTNAQTPLASNGNPMLEPSAAQQKQQLVELVRRNTEELKRAKLPARREVLLGRLKQYEDQIFKLDQQIRAEAAAKPQMPASGEILPIQTSSENDAPIDESLFPAELKFGTSVYKKKAGDIYLSEDGDELKVTATPDKAANKVAYEARPASPFTKKLTLKDGKTLIRQEDDEPNAKKRRYVDESDGTEYFYDGTTITRPTFGKKGSTSKAVVSQPERQFVGSEPQEVIERPRAVTDVRQGADAPDAPTAQGRLEQRGTQFWSAGRKNVAMDSLDLPETAKATDVFRATMDKVYGKGWNEAFLSYQAATGKESPIYIKSSFIDDFDGDPKKYRQNGKFSGLSISDSPNVRKLIDAYRSGGDDAVRQFVEQNVRWELRDHAETMQREEAARNVESEARSEAEIRSGMQNPTITDGIESGVAKAASKLPKLLLGGPAYGLYDAISSLNEEYQAGFDNEARIGRSIAEMRDRGGATPLTDYLTNKRKLAEQSDVEYASRLAVEFGRTFVKTAISDSLKGIDFVDSVTERYNPFLQILPEQARPTVRVFGNAIAYALAYATDPEKAKNLVLAKSTDGADKRLFFSIGRVLDDALGNDPTLEGSTGAKITNAFASSAAFLAMGFLAPEAQIGSGWKSFNLASAGFGALTQAGAGYDEAVKAGFTGSKADFYAMAQGLLGGTEGFALGATAGRAIKNADLRQMFATEILKWAIQTGKATGKEAGEETLQEFVQSTGGKIVMAALKDQEPDAFKKIQNIIERLPAQVANTIVEEVPIAAVAGGTMGGGLQAISRAQQDGPQVDLKNRLIQFDGQKYTFGEDTAPVVQEWIKQQAETDVLYQKIEDLKKQASKAKSFSAKKSLIHKSRELMDETAVAAGLEQRFLERIVSDLTPVGVSEDAEVPSVEPTESAEPTATPSVLGLNDTSIEPQAEAETVQVQPSVSDEADTPSPEPVEQPVSTTTAAPEPESEPETTLVEDKDGKKYEVLEDQGEMALVQEIKPDKPTPAVEAPTKPRPPIKLQGIQLSAKVPKAKIEQVAEAQETGFVPSDKQVKAGERLVGLWDELSKALDAQTANETPETELMANLAKNRFERALLNASVGEQVAFENIRKERGRAADGVKSSSNQVLNDLQEKYRISSIDLEQGRELHYIFRSGNSGKAKTIDVKEIRELIELLESGAELPLKYHSLMHIGQSGIYHTKGGKHFATILRAADELFRVNNKEEADPAATEAAHEAATSPKNDLPEPSEAQIEAGNYKKGHINIGGLDISVENPVGSTRSGTNKAGKKWSIDMAHHYGYIKRTVGADEEHIDVFVKDGVPADYSGNVFVVDQFDPETNKFDEHKVMLGFESEDEARKAYASNYSKDWKGLKAITAMPMDEFKTWVRDGKKAEPVANLGEVNEKAVFGFLKNVGEYSNGKFFVDKSKPVRPFLDARTKLLKMAVPDKPVAAEIYRAAVQAINDRIQQFTNAGSDLPTDIVEPQVTQDVDLDSMFDQAMDAEYGTEPVAEDATFTFEDYLKARQKAADGLEKSEVYNKALAIVAKNPNWLPYPQKSLKAGDKYVERKGGETIYIARPDAKRGGTTYSATPNGIEMGDITLFGFNEKFKKAEESSPESITQNFADAVNMDAVTPENIDQIAAMFDKPKAEKPKPEVDLDAMFDQAMDAEYGKSEEEKAKDDAINGLIDAFGFDDVPRKSAIVTDDAPQFDENRYNSAIKPALEKAYASFTADTVQESMQMLIKALGESGLTENHIRQMKPYIVRFMQDTMAAESVPAAESQTDHEEVVSLAKEFNKLFSQGRKFATIVEARQVASEVLNRKIEPGTQLAKTVDEAIELGVVLAAKGLVTKGRIHGHLLHDIYTSLVGLYDQQPNLNVRTSTSVREQAYSTPAPLAFIASELAGVTPNKKVFEPTAGNGMLLIGVGEGNNVVANELNRDRFANLEQLLPTASLLNADATELSIANADIDVVIGNPPFGVVKDDSGVPRSFQVNDRYKTNEIDHAIIFHALKAMKDDGRAVFILGGVQGDTEAVRSDKYNSKAKKEFYISLFEEYNVVDHFTVNGDLYKKQGAAYPVDVIVINGRGKSNRVLPAADVPRVYNSWNELSEVLTDEYKQRVLGSQDRGDVSDATRRGDAASDNDSTRQGAGTRQGSISAPSIGTTQSSSDGRSDGQADGNRGVQGDGTRQSNGGRNGQTTDPRESTSQGTSQSTRSEDNAEDIDRDDESGSGEGVSRNNRSDVGGSTVDDATRRAAVEKRRAESAPVQTDKAQAPYKPLSKAYSFDVLVPTNMEASVQDALAELEAEVGDIDKYVGTKLEWDDPSKYLSAEGIDTVGLAIFNIEKGAGFIIGDQTGMGKGRMVASIMRYALLTGKTPIFVTEKPNLYKDIIRDLVDTGTAELSDNGLFGVTPLLTNGGEKIPLNATEDGDATVFLKTQSSKQHEGLIQRLINDGDLGEFNAIFTTYNQMQTVKGERTVRHDLLEAFADNSIVIFDESHNAGGQADSNGAKNKAGATVLNRANFARQIAAQAQGVVYSSATFAKRPEVMDLYFKTDISEAVSDLAALPDIINAGGVPLQQVVSSTLARAGQYLRRERSFEGVEYSTELAKVDRSLAGDVSSIMADIYDFSQVIGSIAANVDKELKAEGKSLSGDGSTGGAGASSTNFTSIMHNLVSQMLLGLKAPVAARMAVESIKNGEKPVLTLSSTMGSFIEDYADTYDLNDGDAIDLNFGNLLERYLERSRELLEGKPFAKKTRRYLTDDDIGPEGVRLFKRIQDKVRSVDWSSVPASPIDYIRQEIIDAGYEVAEITGRRFTIDYSDRAYPRFKIRPAAEIKTAGRTKAIDGFQNGSTDAIILNQAGSTGLSLHADTKAKNQQRRHMIIVQPELNIDTHMQMLGRVHRTGQVVTPRYTQLVADVPAEKRPASILAKKMASLNANTTASRSSALTAKDVPDFMNKYGDEVAADFMRDNPDIHKRLGSPLGKTEIETDDAMRKITGRIPLLPLDVQEQIYESLEDGYNDLIQQLESMGLNMLEAKTLDLDARTISSEVLFEGKGTSPFAQAAYAETVDIKKIGKPFTAEQIVASLSESIGRSLTDDEIDNMTFLRESEAQSKTDTQEIMMQFQAYREEHMARLGKDADQKRIDAENAKLNGMAQSFREMRRVLYPGAPVELATSVGSVTAIVLGVEHKGRAVNPLAPSTWHVRFALADARRQLTFPMSRLGVAGSQGDVIDVLQSGKSAVKPLYNYHVEVREDSGLVSVPIIRSFDKIQKQTRETRTMLTGNLLAAFGKFGKGQIVNFTNDKGELRQGILMAGDFNLDKEMKDLPVVFETPDQIVTFLEKTPALAAMAVTTKGDFRLTQRQDGSYNFTTAGTKAAGGHIFLNAGLTETAGVDFVKTGTSMVLKLSNPEAVKAVLRYTTRAMNMIWQTQTYKDVAKDIVAPPTEESPAPRMSSIPSQAVPMFYSQLERVIEQKMPAKADGDHIRGIIKDTKKEERDWSGIDEFLNTKLMFTKDEVLSFVRANEVQVQEVEKGSSQWVGDELIIDGERVANLVKNDDGTWSYESDLSDGSLAYASKEKAKTEAEFETTGTPYNAFGTKYDQFTLPGGENYRELLLTLPTTPLQSRATELEVKKEVYGLNGAEKAEYARISQQLFRKEYRSRHFDEANILAHVRFDSRDGGKTLHIAEIQSDLHQEGREKGYADPESVRRLQSETEALEKQVTALTRKTDRTPEEDVEHGRLIKEHHESGLRLYDAQHGVPDAPFKKSWHELAMKRILRYAVENGFERVTWDTGETQADRYDLSKQIDSVRWRRVAAGSYRIEINKNGRDVGDELKMPEIIAADKIADFLGKETAERITSSEDQSGVLKGDNLKVGASGMRGFYDKILPSFTNKYVKKWGGKVDFSNVTIKPPALGLSHQNQVGDLPVIAEGFRTFAVAQAYAESNDLQDVLIIKDVNDGGAIQGYKIVESMSRAKTAPVHSLTITPAMQDSLATEPQPLFSNANKADEQQRMTLEEMRDLPYVPTDELIGEGGAEYVRTGDLLKMNAKGHELLRRSFEQYRIEEAARKGKTLKQSDYDDIFGGTFLEPQVVQNTIAVLRNKANEAAELGYNADEVATFNDAADQLAAAAAEGNGTAVIFILDRALPHERFHQAEYLGAAEKTLLNRHSNEKKALLDIHPVRNILLDKHYSKLGEYTRLSSEKQKNAYLRSEIPALLLEWTEAELKAVGITPDMVDDFFLTWFEGYVEKNGIESLDNFDKDELDVKTYLEQVRNANEQARPNGSTNEANNGQQGQPNGQTTSSPPSGQGGPSSGFEDGVVLDAPTFKGRQQQKRQAERELGLSGNQRLRSLPLTLRRAGIDAIDEAYEVFRDPVAIEAANDLLELHGVEGSIALLRSIPANAIDAQHGILSFILIKTLQSHAASIRQSDPETAQKHFQLSLDLAREHAVAATQLGRFTRVPSIIGPSVETLKYAIQGIIEARDSKWYHKTLSPEAWDKIEAMGSELEDALTQIETLRRDKRNLQAKVTRLKEEQEGKRKRRATSANRKSLVKLIKADKDRMSVVSDARARLHERFAAPSDAPAMSAIPQKSAIPQDSLSEDDLNDFANVGADILIDGLASDEEYLPSDFKADMLAEFGDAIEPYFDQIYTASCNRRNQWLNQERYKVTKSRLEVKYNEGEELDDWEVLELLGQEKLKQKRRRFIERYHEITAHGSRRNPRIDAYKRIITDLTQGEPESVALGAMILAEDLNASQAYRRLKAMGVENEAEQREALRKGAEIWKQAQREYQKEQDAIANSILEAEKDVRKIDDIAWQQRRRLDDNQKSIAMELNRIKHGEGWYALSKLVNTGNAMRTIMASADVSGVMRQGGFFMFSAPEEQKQALINLYKSLGEKGFGRAIMDIEAQDRFLLSQRAGIDYAIAGKTDEGRLQGEELFRGEETIESIPIIGKLVAEGVVKWSERTYTAFLDTQRFMMFNVFAEELISRGLTMRENAAEFRQIADFINVATGRGTMPSNKFAKMLMDLPLFAPRYTLSRLQLLNMTLNPVAYANMPPVARKIIARKAARFYGTTMGILGIAAGIGWLVGGISVNFDDDDDDFLKIKIGSTKYDIFVGALQPAKLIIKIAHSAIRTKAGFDNRLPGEFGTDVVNAVGRFVRGKLSPIASLITDFSLGSDYVGNEFTWAKAISSRLMPLVVNEIIQAYTVDGVAGVARAVPATVVGIGASTYKDRAERPETEAEKFAAKAVAYNLKTKPQTEDDRRRQELVNNLKARSRNGEDVTAELEAAVKVGDISDRQSGDIKAAASKSYLIDKAEGLSLDMFERAFNLATPLERIDMMDVLNRKMKDAEVEGKLLPDQRQRLEKLGGRILGHVEMPAPVAAEFEKFKIKTPDVGDKLTVIKGEDPWKLDPQELDRYRRGVLEKVYTSVDELLKTDAYKKANPEQQERMIEKVMTKARGNERKVVKRELNGGRGPLSR